MSERLFKRVNVCGLDFYVDYLDNGEIICVKEVHSGRRLVYNDVVVGKKSMKSIFLEKIGIKEPEKEESSEPAKKEVKHATRKKASGK